MKNIARNTLTYSGKVTLSQWVGSKKIVVGQTHNSGGKLLFDFLASCFIGDFGGAYSKLPRQIGIYTEKNGLISSGHKFPLIAAAKQVESTAKNSTVRYSFSIPFEVISSISSFENVYIGLYPENPINPDAAYADYLANFSLRDLKKSSFFLNSALVVDWDLQIINGGTAYDESTLSD